jgi:hypothetical protein
MTDRDELRRLIDVIEKASSSVQLDQAIEDIKTFSNTVSFLNNKLEARLKGGNVKPKGKPKSQSGKAIAPPLIPKPNVQQPQTTADTTASSMTSAVSNATTQADYERLKPQASQGTISTS